MEIIETIVEIEVIHIVEIINTEINTSNSQLTGIDKNISPIRLHKTNHNHRAADEGC